MAGINQISLPELPAIQQQNPVLAAALRRVADYHNATTKAINSLLPFSDASPLIKNAADASKKAKFSAAGIASATTRTYGLPDADTTLGGLSVAQTWSADQTFAGNILADAASVQFIGSQAKPFRALFSSAWNPTFAGDSWSIFMNGGGGEILEVDDKHGVPMAAILGSGASRSWVFYGDVIAGLANTWRLGTSVDRWAELWVRDINYSGNLTGAINSDGSGNASIGIGTPAARLHVYGTGGATEVVRVETSNSNTGSLFFYGNDAAPGTFRGGISSFSTGNILVQDASGSYAILFNKNTQQTLIGANQTLMTLKANGANPGEVLFAGCAFANLPAATNGSLIYCTNANSITDGAAAGSAASATVPLNPGTGTFLQRINGAWRVM